MIPGESTEGLTEDGPVPGYDDNGDEIQFHHSELPFTSEPKICWSREEVQRVLYHIIRHYEHAMSPVYSENEKQKLMPRRFILFGRRLPALGGDSELLHDAIRIGKETLKDNNWWPEDNV